MFSHGKKKLGKNIEKGDVVTRFWYTLKNLDPQAMKNINKIQKFQENLPFSWSSKICK